MSYLPICAEFAKDIVKVLVSKKTFPNAPDDALTDLRDWLQITLGGAIWSDLRDLKAAVKRFVDAGYTA